jgi:hypothetical protein
MLEVLRTKRKSTFLAWLGWAHMLGLAAWFIIDLLRTLLFAVRSWGWLSGISDAVVIYRLGEALIALPLGVYLFAAGLRPDLLSRARWLVWAGALLAGLSFLGLQGRISWAVLALVLAGLGLLAPWLARLIKIHMGRGASWLALGLLVLLHLAVYAGGFLFHGYAVAPYPSAPPRPALTRDERWQQDLRYMGEELARLHKDPFHTVSEAAYWEGIHRLEADIPHLSDAQVVVEMMRLAASIGDAHTGLSAWNTGHLRGVPIDLRWYGDGLYVRGVSEAYPAALGKRVLKIGPLTAEQVYARLLPLISHENESWARLQSSSRYNIYEVLQSAGAVDQDEDVTLTLQDASETELVVGISPLSLDERVQFLNAEDPPAYYKSRPEQPFWYEYLEVSQALYFRYSACVDMLGFRSLMGELWNLVEARQPQRLVIDLRSNGGGNSLQFEWFFMPGLKKHPYLNDPQRLYVLIDRGTFSSASDNAAHLRLNTRATFVGEQTGGKPNAYGEVRRFRLPNSGAEVLYSTKFFEIMDGDPPAIEPEIVVPLPAEAVFSGRDPVLELVLPEEIW